MPELDDRIREELRRAAAPADPSGVFDRVLVRKVRRHIARQIGIAALAMTVLAGSITGAWALSKAFRRSAVKPTPAAPTVRNGQILFLSYRGQDEGCCIPQPIIYAMNPDGTDVTRVSVLPRGIGFLAISPDGTKVAFDHPISEGRGELEVSNLDGTGLRTLTTVGDPEEPTWSPDGARITFSQFGLSPAGIFVIPASGGKPVRLTSPPAFSCTDSSASWSPDGARIAFERDCTRSTVWVVNSDGTNPTPLMNDSKTSSGGASWSPDGRRIALISSGQIFVESADGSHPTQLTHEAALLSGALIWSPDGKQIVFSRKRLPPVVHEGNDEEIFVINADGSGLRDISNNPSTDIALAWRPFQAQTPPSPNLPPCTPDHYSLSVAVQGATQALVPAVMIHLAGVTPCHLRANVTLRIEDDQDHLLDVDGNEGNVTVEADLPADLVSVAWFWRNWCGPPTAVVYRASSPGAGAATHRETGTPICDDPGNRSRLGLPIVTVQPVSPSP